MKNMKTSSLLRLIAFLLITVVLVGVVGVVSEGLENTPDDNSPATGNSNTQTPPASDVPTVTLRYENYLSGLQCSYEESMQKSLCYLMSPSSDMYGIQGAELTIEVPLENGKSRLLVYTSDTDKLGKIGAIAPMRGYMSTLFSSFGGILVHNGTDDTVNYQAPAADIPCIDISKSNAYSYSEGQGLHYTNGNLISNALEGLNIPYEENTAIKLPYVFPNSYDGVIRGQIQCQNVTVPNGTYGNVRLIYDISSSQYRVESNGAMRMDYHSGDAVGYKNAFVLFCDTTTYERSDTTELVLELTSGGTGYYFTEGTMIKFIWSVNENGSLEFRDTTGQILIINRGASYITFCKTTQRNNVTIY